MLATTPARPLPAWTKVLVTALAVGGPGCLPNPKADVRKDDKDVAITQASYTDSSDAKGSSPEVGRRIAPRRCGLTIAILSRPADDPALGDALWRSADEQAIPPETMRSLEANGLRAGVITGGLPVEVEGVLKPRPPARPVDLVRINVPDGEATDLALSSREEPITLMVNRGGRTFGRDYTEAKGLVRVTAARESGGTVRLNLAPEIHHGPVQQGYAAAPEAGPFSPKEFMIKNGQAEETFRDLAAEVRLKPGQVVAVGARGDAAMGLGGLLFSGTEPNSDRVVRRVVLIWAEAADGINPLDRSTAPGSPEPEPARPRGPLAFGPRTPKGPGATATVR